MGRAYEIDRTEWSRSLKAVGLSQSKLAARVGMHINSMSLKVNGKREFTVSELIRIADELHTSPLNLIDIVEPDGGTSGSTD